MDISVDTDVLRNILYSGMLGVGDSPTAERLHHAEHVKFGERRGTSYSSLRCLIPPRQRRALLGDCFSSTNSEMYLDRVGYFGYLAPMYATGALDLQLFNNPGGVEPLYDFTERSFLYLSDKDYAPESHSTDVIHVFNLLPGKDSSSSSSPSSSFEYSQMGKIRNGTCYYYLGENHFEVCICTTPATYGSALLHLKGKDGILTFKHLDAGSVGFNITNSVLYRLILEIVSIEAWVYILSSGTWLDLRKAKRDLHRCVHSKTIGGAIKETVGGYELNMLHYQKL
jgi:hypothetical protein